MYAWVEDFRSFLFRLVSVWARILHTSHQMRARACIPMSNYHMFPDMHVAPLSSFTLITFSITFLGHIHSTSGHIPHVQPSRGTGHNWLCTGEKRAGCGPDTTTHYTVLSGFIFIIFHFGQASGNWSNQFEGKSAKNKNAQIKIFSKGRNKNRYKYQF